jgi:hypothetical protein
MKRICIAIAALLFTSFAFAADVGVAHDKDSGDALRLTDEVREVCVKGSRRAVYVIGDNERSRAVGKVGAEIEGCWLYQDGTIHVAFADGDAGSFSANKVTWANGFKPKKTGI